MFSKKYWLKSKLSKFLTQIENFDQKQDFRNFWPKFKFLENFDHNRDFQKFWQKSKFLENFDRNREFRNYWAKSKFFENFHRNRDFRIFLPNSNFFENFDPKQDFQNFWQKLKFFKNFDRDWDIQIFDRNRNCSKTLIEIEIFDKSKFFENVDRNRDSRNIWPKLLKYFEFFLPKSWYFIFFFTKIENFDRNQILDQIDVFWKFLTQIKIFGIGDRNLNCSKIFTESRFWKLLTDVKIFRKFWSLTRFSK